MFLSSPSYKKMNTNNVNLNKLFVVSTVQERVGFYVGQILKDKGLDYRDVAEKARGEISHSAVWDIVNGRVKDIKVSTLESLAKGLGVPLAELLFVAAGGKEEGTDEKRLAWYYSQLPEQQRRDVLLMIEALHTRYTGIAQMVVKTVDRDPGHPSEELPELRPRPAIKK